jgi:hypothetical protein
MFTPFLDAEPLRADLEGPERCLIKLLLRADANRMEG